jgi:hypothetical protein
MRLSPFPVLCVLLAAAPARPLHAHLLGGPARDDAAAHYDRSVKPPLPPGVFRPSGWDVDRMILAQNGLLPGAAAERRSAPGTEIPDAVRTMAALFLPFAPEVRTRWDDQFLYVESDGMPSHRMMVGITAWQQQVPLPQPYTGDNAWRIPLHPIAARMPLSARSHFFRGAIAVAVNGVPIFNPIKNDGRTDTFLAGELDEFGGHAGRADDYHYHVAPLHLEKTVGKGKPIAYALDGYPIYGLAEPDGSAARGLDRFNGHADAGGSYHYHATLTYPYVNGGFHGEVTERGGQVDPQPRAREVRPALPPLPGAKITAFARPKPGSYSLQYQVGGESRAVNYSIQADGSYRFDFVDGRGQVRSETYRGEQRGGGAPGGNPAPGVGRASTPRGSPPLLCASGSSVYVLRGSTLFVLDGKTLRLQARKELSNLEAPPRPSRPPLTK